MTELLSPATRFITDEVNTTTCPLSEMVGGPLGPFACVPGRDAGTVGGAALAIADERVVEAVRVTGHEVRRGRRERHVAPGGADRGTETAEVALDSRRADAGP